MPPRWLRPLGSTLAAGAHKAVRGAENLSAARPFERWIDVRIGQLFVRTVMSIETHSGLMATISSASVRTFQRPELAPNISSFPHQPLNWAANVKNAAKN